MPRLVIANVDSSAMCGSGRDAEDYAHSAMSATRLLALTGDDDLIVLPEPPAEDFLHYLNELLGRSLSLKNVIVPAQGGDEGLIWSYRALNDGDVARQLLDRAGSLRGWELEAYFFDRPVLALADALGLDLDERTAGFLRAGGAEAFNSKSVYRQIADAAGAPTAEGRVVSSADELADALRGLLDRTGRVIVKQDLNLGGAGNTVFTTANEDSAMGARTVVRIKRDDDLDGLARRWWPSIAVDRNTCAVVEAYHPAAAVLYSELHVNGPGQAPALLNFGEMRMEPVFIGFEIPTQRIGQFDLATMAAHSMSLAQLAGERGFPGYMNIDSLVTKDGRVLFTEVNGRMGACTHIDRLARDLVGPNYQRTHALLTRNRVEVPSFPAALTALRRAGLAFDHDTTTGVVIAAEGVATTGVLEYIVFGSDLDHARDLEARTQAVLGGTGA